MKKKNIKKIILGAIGVVAAGHIGYATLLMANTTMYGVPAIQISPEEEAARRMFNSQFTAYERTDGRGAVVRSLISVIEESNVTNDVESPTDEKYVLYTGPEISELRKNSKYTIEVKYNNTGYVCEVIVTETEENVAARRMFNSQFTVYEGTDLSGAVVRSLISAIKKSNVTNDVESPTNAEYVLYTGPEISELKQNSKYTIKVKYNNTGYVCEVIVTEAENTNEDVIKPIQR